MSMDSNIALQACASIEIVFVSICRSCVIALSMLSGAESTGMATVGCSASTLSLSGSISGRGAGRNGDCRPVGVMSSVVL